MDMTPRPARRLCQFRGGMGKGHHMRPFPRTAHGPASSAGAP